eukprot:scaffold9342_cov126-Isochrysis_galbana.AAC.12
MLAARALFRNRAAVPRAARLTGTQRAMAGGFDPPRYKRDFSPDLVVEGIPDDPMSQPKIYEKDIWKNPDQLVRSHAKRMRRGPWSSSALLLDRFLSPPVDSRAPLQATAWHHLNASLRYVHPPPHPPNTGSAALHPLVCRPVSSLSQSRVPRLSPIPPST